MVTFTTALARSAVTGTSLLIEGAESPSFASALLPSAHLERTCAVATAATEEVYCWGQAYYGSGTSLHEPVRVPIP